MPASKFFLSLVFASTFIGFLSAQDGNPGISDSLNLIGKDATLRKISSQFKFTEGPAADKAGNIFFTDQPNDKIWKYDLKGDLTVFMDKAGRSNGLAFDKKGNIVACADEKNELWSIDPSKKVNVLMDNYLGTKLNGPNDLWIDKSGGIYFTDPYYQRDYWERKKPEQSKQSVFYLPAGKSTPIIVDSTLQQPNGITGSPDGKYLFVADIRANKTYRYEILGKGKITNKQLFVSQGSDGIRLDEKGNLYLSGRGVTIVNPEGVKIGYIPVPSGWVGNLCFGGADRKLLFITASESVYSIQMNVKGAL
ncbi:SMP-30/gluconolactonase/LRE family protein [Pollutibacter soli]|uniref:SMP-30/gluconolactonase/LRE family protein n=1 Tax=Pollutibacter soli TaxID=3034157 RepID=UPI0030135019